MWTTGHPSRRRAAFHEAGHAVVQAYYGFLGTVRVPFVPRTSSGGNRVLGEVSREMIYEPRINYLGVPMSEVDLTPGEAADVKDYVKAYATVLMAGPHAEARFTHRPIDSVYDAGGLDDCRGICDVVEDVCVTPAQEVSFWFQQTLRVQWLLHPHVFWPAVVAVAEALEHEEALSPADIDRLCFKACPHVGTHRNAARLRMTGDRLWIAWDLRLPWVDMTDDDFAW